MVKRPKDDVVVYVEGGGDGNELRTKCRKAFAVFFEKTELGKKRRPRVVACGPRQEAYEDFCTARNEGRNALLLVDSEDAISPKHQPPHGFRPWEHLKQRDNWDRPPRTPDDDCHLMVQCMESWFFADWDATARFFGQEFNGKKKPGGVVDSVAKHDVFAALQQATLRCKTQAPYGKGPHSFELLATIKPETVLEASPWARRFVNELLRRKPG